MVYCLLGWLLFCPFGVRAVTPPGTSVLLLNVVVNGHEHNNIQEISQRGDDLLIKRDQLAALGLVLNAVPDSSTGMIALSSVKQWQWRLDANAQVLYLQVPAQDQRARQYDPATPDVDQMMPHSDPGAVLNYDAQLTEYRGHSSSSVLGDLRLFGDRGLLRSSALQTRSPYLNRQVRLESSFSRSDSDTLHTWTVGDTINGGLAWTRPIRMAGIQMTTNFGLRPDLVTFPRPGISGEVAVPSSVDIYVNGLYQMTRNVDAGPFDINQLPVTNGGGEVSMVVKDGSGRRSEKTQSFYSSNSLLRQGLDSLALEAGSVRRNYASRSADYAGSIASLSYRRGLTSTMTVESHAEGSKQLAMGGMGINWQVGDQGVVSTSWATSHYASRQGNQYGLGYSHYTSSLNYGVNLLKADARFYDLASAYGDARVGTTVRATLGFPLPPGNSSFAVVYTRRMVNYYNDFTYRSQPIASSTLAATYARSLPFHAYGFITALHDFDYEHNSGLFIGLSIPIGRRATLSVSSTLRQGDSYQGVQMQQAAVQRGDVGWQLAAENGGSARRDAGIEYKSDWGLIGAEAEQGRGGYHAVRASASGALVAFNGHLFATNSLQDSFALVDTDGLAGITVLQENRPLGKTDRRGLLLVEDIHAYESNRLSINPNEVPMDAALTYDVVYVRPHDRSGVLAKFPVHRTHGASLKLVDNNRQPLPVGSTATLLDTGAVALVGYDGLAFFSDLQAQNRVRVRVDGRPDCHLLVEYRPQPGILQEIGPLVCANGG